MYRDCKRYLVLLMAVLFVMMSSLACEAKGQNLQVGFVDDIVSADSENHLLTPQAKQEIRQNAFVRFSQRGNCRLNSRVRMYSSTICSRRMTRAYQSC